MNGGVCGRTVEASSRRSLREQQTPQTILLEQLPRLCCDEEPSVVREAGQWDRTVSATAHPAKRRRGRLHVARCMGVSARVQGLLSSLIDGAEDISAS